MSNGSVRHVVIVGGGSAGWITAGLIAAEHKIDADSEFRITLIESPDVKAIGVGEGTWPSMRNTLKKIGVTEFDFINQCSASFKQGTKFVGWKNNQPNDFYYHPFMLPHGYGQSNQQAAWRSHSHQLSFADAVTTQSQLCEAGCAPKQKSTPEYASVVNYGYHLDAGKFGELLKTHCIEKLGVTYLLDHVVAVQSASNGDIAAINTKHSGELIGDLYIDCTGLSSLLLGKHYEIPFQSRKSILFNNTALAIQVPYSETMAPIASSTMSTAQSAGWIWDIGLSERRGVGYTFSNGHVDDDEAEQTLRSYLSKTIGSAKAQSLSSRKITFEPGYRQRFWHKNCVAVGLSSGFLEPLEASALTLVELAATMISEQMPVSREHMRIIAKRFNQRFHYHWENIIEFLKLHYILSQRKDSNYWHEIGQFDTAPERLQELLLQWRHLPPCRDDFVQNDIMFSSASYQYVLYGMDFNTLPCPTKRKSDSPELAIRQFEENHELTRKYLAALPSNRELIDHIQQIGK